MLVLILNQKVAFLATPHALGRYKSSSLTQPTMALAITKK